MATALTHLGYDLWTLQTEPVNERGKHLEDKEELGLCLDYGLQVATDTPVVGQHRENTLIPSDCCHLSQENTGHTHYVRCVCVCSYVRMYIHSKGKNFPGYTLCCGVRSHIWHTPILDGWHVRIHTWHALILNRWLVRSHIWHTPILDRWHVMSQTGHAPILDEWYVRSHTWHEMTCRF